jgi:hypothetical protein
VLSVACRIRPSERLRAAIIKQKREGVEDEKLMENEEIRQPVCCMMVYYTDQQSYNRRLLGKSKKDQNSIGGVGERFSKVGAWMLYGMGMRSLRTHSLYPPPRILLSLTVPTPTPDPTGLTGCR